MRQSVSKSRHSVSEPDVLVRTYPLRIGNGMSLTFYQPEWVQLAYAIEGVMTVRTEEGIWVVPPHRAVWVPAGVRHDLRMHGTVELRSLYFHRGARMPTRSATVGVTPLARELINHVALQGALFRVHPKDRRLAAVLLDQLRELPSLPLHLPSPTSPEAKRAASGLEDWNLTLNEASRLAGVSRRTLERRFVDETGMSVGTWRQQARLLESLKLLAAGESVGQTAFTVGYQNSSAFIHAFKLAFGVSPGAWVF